MHCFTGNPEQARQALDLGFYLSFSGVVTYPKATDVHDSARFAPLDRILVETDAPYLAPVPFRGKRNEPSYVAHTAQRIAEFRGDGPGRIRRSDAAKLRHANGIHLTEVADAQLSHFFSARPLLFAQAPGKPGVTDPIKDPQSDSGEPESRTYSASDSAARAARRRK